MQEYRCDGCGRHLLRGDLRYTVAIDVKAAYDEIEVHLHDLVRDHRSELESLIQQLNKKDTSKLEESVYKKIKLDLCPSCQQSYIQNPLGFRPAQEGSAGNEATVDDFLRSLGYGRERGSDAEE